ncbi:hypothetical protein [Candidatus Accumulibacter sp. ACC007]|uniref:hypothetical protein n=1 Tax=Candidatus Accumulibacter sp. ACC007 TaxID=2823333 RepID=UPI0025BED31D|nr:hypothetical protein [Candidatus Accumulibacter sp. ACC007]
MISTSEHNREHFQNMVASLIPILSMLTSDPLHALLSPDSEPGHERLVTDMSKIIHGNKVVSIGLAALADSTVGSAIGSILLADLAAVAGDRYNYAIDSLTPVTLFIDEAANLEMLRKELRGMSRGDLLIMRWTRLFYPAYTLRANHGQLPEKTRCSSTTRGSSRTCAICRTGCGGRTPRVSCFHLI